MSFTHFLTAHKPLLVITGAGVSVASGIPTYRDHSGQWMRNAPIKHQEFLAQKSMQKRYWARSIVGWQHIRSAHPNEAHTSLAHLEKHGLVSTIITQNVDGLHHLAGSENVIDLHGRMDQVICLSCNERSSRHDMQVRLQQLNPTLIDFVADVLPDGDANIDDYPMEQVAIPECTNCGGTLKPDVVFFGDNVPKKRVAQAMDALQAASGLIIIGSSLQVYSGYRFCKKAAEIKMPIGCINQGLTRADDLFSCKWQVDCADLLKQACAQILSAT